MRSKSSQSSAEAHRDEQGRSLCVDGDLAGWESQWHTQSQYGDFYYHPAKGQWKYMLNESHPEILALTLGDTLYETIQMQGNDGQNSGFTVVIDQGTPHCICLAHAMELMAQDPAMNMVIGAGDFVDSDMVDSPNPLWSVVNYPSVGHFYLNQKGQWHFECSLSTSDPQDVSVQVAVTDESGQTALGAIRFVWQGHDVIEKWNVSVWFEHVLHGYSGRLLPEAAIDKGVTLFEVAALESAGEELIFGTEGWSQWLDVGDTVMRFREDGGFVVAHDHDVTINVVCIGENDEHLEWEHTVSQDAQNSPDHWHDHGDTDEWTLLNQAVDQAFEESHIGEVPEDDEWGDSWGDDDGATYERYG